MTDYLAVWPSKSQPVSSSAALEIDPPIDGRVRKRFAEAVHGSGCQKLDQALWFSPNTTNAILTYFITCPILALIWSPIVWLKGLM